MRAVAFKKTDSKPEEQWLRDHRINETNDAPKRKLMQGEDIITEETDTPSDTLEIKETKETDASCPEGEPCSQSSPTSTDSEGEGIIPVIPVTQVISEIPEENIDVDVTTPTDSNDSEPALTTTGESADDQGIPKVDENDNQPDLADHERARVEAEKINEEDQSNQQNRFHSPLGQSFEPVSADDNENSVTFNVSAKQLTPEEYDAVEEALKKLERAIPPSLAGKVAERRLKLTETGSTGGSIRDNDQDSTINTSNWSRSKQLLSEVFDYLISLANNSTQPKSAQPDDPFFVPDNITPDFSLVEFALVNITSPTEGPQLAPKIAPAEAPAPSLINYTANTGQAFEIANEAIDLADMIVQEVGGTTDKSSRHNSDAKNLIGSGRRLLTRNKKVSPCQLMLTFDVLESENSFELNCYFILGTASSRTSRWKAILCIISDECMNV